ncbi:MAG TPA: hypothetical protein DDY31_18855 [Lachnospiraceae bacterium]|nr:hypothetical protein [Lachnospiraceae bacterium]
MRIKEVSEKLNVTQKTIRYYEEQGFLSPLTEEKNGRKFREYSESDIRTMEMIIELRKLSFSVEEIRVITEEPERIESICREKKEQLARQYEYDRFLLEVFEEIRPFEAKDAYILSNQIIEAGRSVRKAHMEWKPLFKRLDEEFRDDRFQKWEQQREMQREASIKMFAIINSPYCKSAISGYMNSMGV